MYDDDPGSPAELLLETKILLNSVISNACKGARFMSLDLKDYFLGTPMETPEVMCVQLKYFPRDIINKYKWTNLIQKDQYVYIQIKKGKYGLKQAALLAYNIFIKNLKEDGYHPIPHMDSYCKHDRYPTTFCLCVDDFGVKYFCKTKLNHLINSLLKNYKISTDYSGTNYCGLTIKWNYEQGYVDISIRDYVPKNLKKF